MSAAREYKRKCKQAGCNVEFVVSAPSLDEDRMIGYSEPEYCPKHRMLHAKSYSRIAVHHIDIEETEAGFELIRRVEEAKARGEKLGLGPGGIGQFEREPRLFLPSANPNPVEREFPIAEKDVEILQALENHQVIVLVGPTGSGKSTHVPQMLLRSKWSRRGPIVVTQPRIQATRQIPRFVAQLNNSSYGPGAEIGYCHSDADEYDRRTKLLFMTDGKLINDIVSGMVSNYSVIMIDEAHERSVNIDLILGLLKDQLYLYPHLRVIIASATIDHESFINFFGGEGQVPFVLSEGRFYGYDKHLWGAEYDPTKEQWLAPDDPNKDQEWWKQVNGGVQPEREELPNAIADLVEYLCKRLDRLPPKVKQERDGHILVFLPGMREIDRTVSAIRARNLPNVLALPLYARRPLDEQDRALDPKDPEDRKRRRVVVSTNVAETSLTVEGVKFVIDSGYIKESYWNPKTEVAELRTVRHSKAGCRQRWGRAGRLSKGDAFMLYTEQQFEETFPDHTSPNIARSSLEQVILTALAAGVRTGRGEDAPKVLDFAWMPLTGEDRERFWEELPRAFDALKEKRAVDEHGDLTSFGLELRGVPTELDIAAVFAEGDRHAMGVEVATLLPFLKLDFGIQSVLVWERAWDTYKKLDVRRHHLALAYGCRDDLDFFLKLWMVWESLSSEGKRKKWCEEAGIDFKTFKEKIEGERRKLLGSVMDWRKAEKRPINTGKIDALRALIAYCLSNEVYVPMEEEQRPDELSYLDWESYWDGTDYYEEYEDDFDIDPTFSTSSGDTTRSGVFRRLSQSPHEVSEDSLIEIAPVSICYGQDDLDLFIACQRRANFLRPARAKSLGLNLVRLERDWLRVLNASQVERIMLYASLARWRDPSEHHLYKVHLFLPWLVPLDSEVQGTIQAWTASRGGVIALTVVPSKSPLVGDLANNPLSIQGWLAADEIDTSDAEMFVEGAQVTAHVVGYGESKSGEPLLLLSHRCSQARASADFAQRYRNHKDKSIEVKMHRVLEDPLGRRPLFIVREPGSRLDIPMSASDFCGDTHFRPYLGLRFEVGETFQVDIEDILEDDYQEVYLSRIRYLLDEHDQIPRDWDRRIVNVEVLRVDRLGAYLAVKGSGAPYVSFVRRALWPYDFNPRPGDQVRARLRRYERNINVQKLRERLEKGEALPQELDLGIELDLRIPPAYDRFKKRYPEGSLLTVSVDRQLDSGGLLVDLGDGLKAIIYASELGLGEDGNLKSARDYTPGDPVDVRVTRLKDETAGVECSIFRVQPVPAEVKEGSAVEARVLMVRPDRKQPDKKYITCSLDNKYRIDVRSEEPDLSIDVGDVVLVRITRMFDKTAYIQGGLINGGQVTS